MKMKQALKEVQCHHRVLMLWVILVLNYQELIGSVTGFHVASDVAHRQSVLSSSSLVAAKLCGPSRTGLYAAGGAPQYQKHRGVLRESVEVGKGSFLLSIDYDGIGGDTDIPTYQAGNVLALEIQPPPGSNVDENDDDSVGTAPSHTTMNEKTQKDLKVNGGWLRGPYTVSRAEPSTSGGRGFQVLIKDVGYKSHVWATASPGTSVQFGGKFKVPIAEGVMNSAQQVSRSDEDDSRAAAVPQVQRVVLICTGVGVGPCVGAAAELLDKYTSPSFLGRIDVLASFRTREEVAMADDLNHLADAYPNRFQWTPIITSEVGRLSASSENLHRYLGMNDDDTNTISSVVNTHYHLIGNGQLVNEWKAGLAQAGVPAERVTVEMYFNHNAPSDQNAVANIANFVRVNAESFASKQYAPQKAS